MDKALMWTALPFHFWTAVAFVLGCMVGSFLNVCIHRLPLGESVVSPPSHCPHCGYSIPWFLNIPLVTWVWLRGRCANCHARISARYFLVELLTGVFFAGCWLSFGRIAPSLALASAVILCGLIVGTFTDFEHLIVPDQITFGGMVAGVLCSFLVPSLHFSVPGFIRLQSPWAGLRESVIGMAVGAGLVYAILRLGKLFLGRQKLDLAPGTRVVFTESGVKLPEEEIAYEELFYRKTDAVELAAQQVELIDRCYAAAPVRLTMDRLSVGGDSYEPDKVPCLEVVTDRIVLPREAMGPADVTVMAAIGAFLGWPAVLFSLALSSLLGTAVGGTLIAFKRRDWSNRIPYVPYIAAGAVIWIFGGYRWVQ
jgi:leader peptidase (prepilin peptidase)/N-methyltransferase